MNAAQFHLLINHFPIVGTIFSGILLLSGLIFKSQPLKNAALIFLVLCGITGFLANNSGEKAEELAEEIEGVSHQQIHHHEELAEKFFLLSAGIGLISIGTFFVDRKKKNISKWLFILILAGISVNIFLGWKAGKSGGEIRHPEVKEGWSSTPEKGTAKKNPS